jgi:hypothetical protein
MDCYCYVVVMSKGWDQARAQGTVFTAPSVTPLPSRPTRSTSVGLWTWGTLLGGTYISFLVYAVFALTRIG